MFEIARYRIFARLLPVSLILALSVTASADIYECRDADGTISFTNVRRGRCRKIADEADATVRRRGAGQRRGGTVVADRYSRYDSVIDEAARLYQLPPAFIRAVMRVESDFTHDVVSHAGATGLMQLMPRTAAAMGVRDLLEPRQNILGGARYLRVLANLFRGDLVLTIAAYNAGEGAVTRYGGVPPYEETQRYVRRVLGFYQQFLQQGAP